MDLIFILSSIPIIAINNQDASDDDDVKDDDDENKPWLSIWVWVKYCFKQFYKISSFNNHNPIL